jgi:hypothetical protein
MPKLKKTTKTTKKKAPAKVSIPKAETRPRKRKREVYRSFRLHKRIRPHLPPITGPLTLLKNSFKLLRSNWKLFGGLTLVYTLLSLVLVRGFSSNVDLKEIKHTLQALLPGSLSVLTVTLSAYGVLLQTIGSVGTASGSVYQSLLLIIMILTTIWALRSSVSGQKVRLRDAFYKGLYPLAVFITVLIVIGLQLLPLVLGSWLYTLLVGGGIVVSFTEKTVTLLLFILLGTLSFYMITSSLFALFISTIPDMTPLKALRSARQLVMHRRWHVLARIIALLFAVPILLAIIMAPFIILIPGIAEWVFFLLTIFSTIFIVTYMYLLYKNLLNE